jgi:hypothetical protein
VYRVADRVLSFVSSPLSPRCNERVCCRASQSLISISQASSPATKLWCATALRQLSWHPKLLALLVREGVVPALMHLALTSHGKCQQECAEALCHISCCAEVRRCMFIALCALLCAALLCTLLRCTLTLCRWLCY